MGNRLPKVVVVFGVEDPPMEIKEASRLWCYQNSPDVCGWYGEKQTSEHRLLCLEQIWMRAASPFLVFQWCGCFEKIFNGAVVPKIPSRVRLHLAPPEVASPQGYRCPCAYFPMVQLYLAHLEEIVLLLLKGVVAPVLACQWFPSHQEWCGYSKRRAPW